MRDRIVVGLVGCTLLIGGFLWMFFHVTLVPGPAANPVAWQRELGRMRSVVALELGHYGAALDQLAVASFRLQVYPSGSLIAKGQIFATDQAQGLRILTSGYQGRRDQPYTGAHAQLLLPDPAQPITPLLSFAEAAQLTAAIQSPPLLAAETLITTQGHDPANCLGMTSDLVVERRGTRTGDSLLHPWWAITAACRTGEISGFIDAVTGYPGTPVP